MSRASTPPGKPDLPATSGQRADADPIAAVAALQRDPARRLRVPVGVIGPRDATPAQYEAARAIGRGLARMGLLLVCGGRSGVMEAASLGASEAGGTAIAILPDAEPEAANPYAGIVIATGIGEARNAIIARAAFCLVAIGDSFGTLSEVALGRQFGRPVIGLAGAAQVAGVQQAESVDAALAEVARCALAFDATRIRGDAGAGPDGPHA